MVPLPDCNGVRTSPEEAQICARPGNLTVIGLQGHGTSGLRRVLEGARVEVRREQISGENRGGQKRESGSDVREQGASEVSRRLGPWSWGSPLLSKWPRCTSFPPENSRSFHQSLAWGWSEWISVPRLPKSFDSCLPGVLLEYVIPCEGCGRKLDTQTHGAAPKMTNLPG